MKKFTHRFRVAASLEAVANFHRAPGAIKKLTPFPLWMQIHKMEPLAENARAHFTIWAGPIPLRWEAIHTNVSEQGFTDTQIKGPYQYWVHNHQFIAINSKTTEVIDEISAVYGEGLFWGLVTRLMWAGMPILFAFRGWRTRKAIEGEP
jgi:ligand-binding SRPBCC domain-containing protein